MAGERSLVKSIGSNWGVTIVTIVMTFILTPFIIHRLGTEAYGTWALITSITGYLGLLVLGVPMASVRYFSEYVAGDDRPRLNEAVASCTGLYIAMGVMALVLSGLLFVFFDTTYAIPAGLRLEARVSFGLAALAVASGFVAMLPEAVMAAHHDFVIRNAFVIGIVLVRFGLTIGLLVLTPSFVVLAAVQIIGPAIDFTVCLLLVHRRYPGVRIGLSSFQWDVVRKIFSFSIYVLVLNAAGRLALQTDPLVIGATLGVSQIPYYAVANNFVVYALEFIVAIAAVVMPTTTRLKTQGRLGELRAIFLRWSKIAFCLTMIVGLFLIVLGPRFIGWWIDASFEGPAGVVLQILMISSLIFLPVRGVALPVLMGLGKPVLPSLTFLGAGVLNLVLSLVLARPLGLVGVALGTAIPNILFAAVVLIVACRELGIGVFEYLRYVVPRTVLGGLPVLIALLWFKLGLAVHSLAGLVTAGVSVCFLFAVLSVFFVYRNDPYLDLRGEVARLVVRSR